MKKIVTLIAILSMVALLLAGFTGCDLFKQNEPEHTHAFVDGKCECGESDPNYKPTPEKPAPEINLVEGEYGILADVPQGYSVSVQATDVKSADYSVKKNAIEESGVALEGRAWVMYSVSVQPKARTSETAESGRVEVPAPIPGVDEYEVWELESDSAKKTQFSFEEGFIVVDSWNYASTYLIFTEEPFDILDYYDNESAQELPEHLNVGEEKAEDAYQKGQTRALKVYVCIDYDEAVDTNADIVLVNGLTLDQYNQQIEEFEYKSIHTLYANPRVSSTPELEFAGWYLGEITDDGQIVLEDTPYSVEHHFVFEMPAEDLTIFAVYSEKFIFHVNGVKGHVSVNGGEFSLAHTVEVCFNRTFTLSVEPNANCYFSHWAYSTDRDTPLSTDQTFTYVAEDGRVDVVAVCVPYSQYNFTVAGALSAPIEGDDEADYGILVNGEEYHGSTYETTAWEYQKITVTALPKLNCKFIGWYVGDKPENVGALLYDSATLMAGITRTDDPNYVLKGSELDGKILIAIYEVLPQYKFSAECYFIDDNYGSFASIYVNGHPRGDNCYYGYLAEGYSVTVKAVPEMNCFFDGWYYITLDDMGNPIFGALASKDAEFTFTMGASDTLVYAKMRCYPTYSVSAYAGEGADIYINGENHYGSIRHSYEEGEKLTLRADVKEGFEFKGWYRNDGVAEQLVTTDIEFEYTVGASDVSFLAHVEPIIYHQLTLDIKGPSITVDIDEHTGLTYIPMEEVYRVYVTNRREGASVTIRANNIEGMGQEFAYWLIGGEIITDREYTFIMGNGDIDIKAYCRDRAHGMKMETTGSSDVTAIYSTDYESGERYIGAISVPVGTELNRVTGSILFEALEIYYVRVDGVAIRYDDVAAQCDIDFGGAIEYNNTSCIFAKVGRYTVTVTDKINPELKLSFTVQVVGYDETGTYVWVSRTGAKYHVYPNCSNMQTVTIMTLEEAEAAGYEPCKICCNHDE